MLNAYDWVSVLAHINVSIFVLNFPPASRHFHLLSLSILPSLSLPLSANWSSNTLCHHWFMIYQTIYQHIISITVRSLFDSIFLHFATVSCVCFIFDFFLLSSPTLCLIQCCQQMAIQAFALFEIASLVDSLSKAKIKMVFILVSNSGRALKT